MTVPSTGADEAAASLCVDNETRCLCWNEAVRSFGTAFIFEARAIRLRLPRLLLTFVGFALPGLAGAASGVADAMRSALIRSRRLIRFSSYAVTSLSILSRMTDLQDAVSSPGVFDFRPCIMP